MQSIRTKYIPASNFKPSRIQAKCEARTIYRSYDHGLNSEDNHAVACAELVEKMKWATHAPMVGGTFAGCMYWVFSKGSAEVRS